ncbi:MAG: thioredoxin family protein [Gemmatimonadetes bacterium]|nr:thioredoxin family protein [Gemmatimonadota bacterium]
MHAGYAPRGKGRTARVLLGALALGLAAVLSSPATLDAQAPAIGKAAPAFTLPDTKGTQHSLSQYAGKYVVLEWLNYDCPYVKKHYSSGNIPGQQQKWRDKGVVWLAIVSSAPGTQGYFEPAAMDARTASDGSKASAVLLDPSGKVGHAYDARTTPHMYVIDPQGILRYMGGIDDKPTARVEDLAGATQLADKALEELFAGKPVSTPTSRPYGCSVKYAG